jgi:hypothetical protein
MITIQTSRIFVVPEVEKDYINNIPIPPKIEIKKEKPTYIKKVVKYFIPKFYI